MIPLFVSIPHSGEEIPDEAPWLKGLPEPIVMCDVDRFVDVLYQPAVDELKVPVITTPWHRYLCDLNRLPEDVDSSTVEGSPNPPGTFKRGFLWSVTTLNQKLMPGPISQELHHTLVKKYFVPFHEQVRAQYQAFEKQGATRVYHIDAHSMPSIGTSEHRDPGQRRPQICVSDSKAKSCSPEFKDLVVRSYEAAGFQVGYNWPYFGGRVTETYGNPGLGHHALQVELNRGLYMDEQTKRLKEDLRPKVQEQIKHALRLIKEGVGRL